MSTKPTIETLAGLYAAAIAQQEQAQRAYEAVVVALERHGYTLAEVANYRPQDAAHPVAA